MFPLLETIRISNGEVENLHYHQQRMDASYGEIFGKVNPFRLNEIIDTSDLSQKKVYKCRLLYGSENYSTTFQEYKPQKINSLKIVHVNTIDYHLKYSDRSELNKLLAKKGSCDDLLIIKNGLVTDTSYANIAFYDGSRWITPASPLLRGCRRQHLLEHNIIYPANIIQKDISNFSGFRIFNAMLRFDEQNTISVKSIIP